MAEDDLSAEQTEKLLQFQDLSGIEDMPECRTILERHGWDIEVAVQARFAEEEGRDNVYQEAQAVARPEPRTPPVDVQPLNQRIYTVARARPQSWRQWSYFVVLFPFRFFYTTVFDVLRFCSPGQNTTNQDRLLRPDPRRVVTDPQGDVRGFIQSFSETYGDTHPRLYNGTYSQALNEAKTELSFLLVYLHGDDHQDTQQFCRQTLCDEGLVEFVNNRMLFWACNTNSPEGYRVSQALRENTYPFMALIVLRENKMTVVARIEGPIAASNLIPRLTRLMEENEASLVTVRAERAERSLNRSIREEQDSAYEQSLKEDQEKARKKREEGEKVAAEVEQKLQQEQEEQRRIQEVARRKESLRDELPVEPGEDDPDVVRILLKLPNGTRLERRFNKHHSLKHLYNYVFVHEAAPDDFQIVTNFPRKVLPCQPNYCSDSSATETKDPPTFTEAGLGKSEMLFVHDNEA